MIYLKKIIKIKENVCMKYVIGLLILCLLIFVHELGHFLAAKACGVYVEEFALGMGPRIWSKISKKSGTRYSLHLIPIGGFCSMKGEGEVEDDTEEQKERMHAKDSFEQASVWKRICIVLAGPMVNLLLGVCLAVILVSAFGQKVPKVTEVESIASVAGLQKGDIITEVNGTKISSTKDLYFYDFYYRNHLPKTTNLSFLRDGKEQSISYSLHKEVRYGVGMSYGIDDFGNIVITDFLEDSVLKQAGLAVGDKITHVDGIGPTKDMDLSEYLDEHPFTEDLVSLTYVRKDKQYHATVQPKEMVFEDLGFNYKAVADKRDNVFQNTWQEMRYESTVIMKSLSGLFTGRFKLSELSGPVMMVDVIGSGSEELAQATTAKDVSASTEGLLSILLMLTVNLGIFNLLPIPALDGGHLAFLLLEVIRKKRIDPKKEQKIHAIGLTVLLCVSAVVIIKDLWILLMK